MKVINLWGGPGCGKSTTAAGLFHLMKLRGHKVELVTEFAKELTYDRDWDMLTRQEKILKEQYNRQKRLAGQVDYAITDSPLPLNLIYARPDLKLDDSFNAWCMDLNNEFDNLHVMLKRVKPYSHYGRKESSEKAIEIDQQCVSLLEEMSAPYHWVLGDEDSPTIIYNIIEKNYEIILKNQI